MTSNRGQTQPSRLAASPVYELDVRVAFHQHEAAAVLQQGREGGVRDATLNGAVASVVSGRVQVFGDRPGGGQTDRQAVPPSEQVAFNRNGVKYLHVPHKSCSRMMVMRCMCSHLCQTLVSMERMGFQYDANWDWEESLDPLCCRDRTWRSRLKFKCTSRPPPSNQSLLETCGPVPATKRRTY